MVNNTLGTYATSSEEFKGIKRINVFKYFEEYNMLLPIETFHDTATNTVYTHVDELGTYCLMDMEIWLSSIGVESTEPEETTVEPSPTMSQPKNENWSVLTVPVSDAKASGSDDDVSIVYIVDVRDCISQDEFSQIKKSIRTSAKNISNSSGGKAKFRLITISYQKTGLIFPSQHNPNDKLTNIDNFLQVVNALQRESAEKSIDGNLTDALQAAMQYNYSFENAYFFTFIKNDPSSVYSVKLGDSILQSLIDRNIDTSIISQYNIGNDDEVNGYAYDVASQTQGMLVKQFACADDIYHHIYNHDPEYNLILMGGMRTLPSNFGKLSNTSVQDYDSDGLLDVEEIDFENDLIIINEDNNVALPTLEQYLRNTDKEYVKNIVSSLKLSEQYSKIKTCKVLPTNSNPLEEDCDNDGLKDYIDPRPYSSINNGDIMPEFSSKTTTTLQKCLEYLGYLDMNGNSYGTFGGLTKAAVQTFQLNYGFQPLSGNSGDYKVDYNTFFTIVNVALNNDYDLYSDNTNMSKCDTYYTFIQLYINQDTKKYNIKKFFPNIKSQTPKLTVNELKSGVTVVSIDGLFDKMYYLDFTSPIEKVFIENAKECRENCYTVIYDNGKYYSYRLDEHGTLKERSDLRQAIYLWYYMRVKTNSDWDIKVQKNWNKEFGNSARYFNGSFKFIFNGNIISTEQLGNIMLGFTGKACGFSNEELVNVSSLYSFVSGDGWDNTDDSQNIERGIILYKEKENEILMQLYPECFINT